MKKFKPTSLIYTFFLAFVLIAGFSKSALAANVDSLVPVFDDKLIEERIKNIPTVMNLEFNQDVKMFIDLYTIRKRALTEKILGKAEYYFPLFEQVLDANQMPLELKYLTVIESAVEPAATSCAGAAGLWQFIRGTGKMYGLKVDKFVDERRDPVESTMAAAKFLKELYGMYHDWLLALAAYNCGPGYVTKALRLAGKDASFWDIYKYLPRETRSYVPAFIAAVYTMNHYKDHNLSPFYYDLPNKVDTVKLDANVNLYSIAELTKVPIEVLAKLNPQFTKKYIPYSSKGYMITMPTEKMCKCISLTDSIDALTAKSKVPYNAVVAEFYPANLTKVYYTVRAGDNLGQIAMKYKTQVTKLKEWNNLNSTLIRVGQRLIVYVNDKNT